MNRKKSLLVLIGSVPVSLLIASIYSNQKIASMLHYQDALFGSIGFTGIGNSKIYIPFSWIGWYYKFGNVKDMQWIFAKEAFTPAYYSVFFGFVLAMFIVMMNKERSNDTHGTAHFATKKEIYDFGHFPDNRKWWEIIGSGIGMVTEFFKIIIFGSENGRLCAFPNLIKKLASESRKSNDNNMLEGKGVFLGYLDDGTYLRDNAKTHTLLIAPTRSGKGVGHIIPTLLTWQGSTVVTDVKGENWELTSGYRKSQLGNDVFMFKPTSENSCHYNPLGEIRIGTVHEMGDLQLVTKILVDPTGKGSEGNNAHWVDNAWQLLQGVVLHLLYQKRYHNYEIDQKSGEKIPAPGRMANLADVLDFLYDAQDGSELNHDKEHEDFLDRERNRNRNNSEISGSNMMPSAPEEIVGPLDEVVPERVKGEEDKNEKAADETSDLEARPKLTDRDGNVIDSADNKGEGLEGLQKKLKSYITDCRFVVITDETTGEKHDYAAPFCHAPDDDKDLFKRLYPDKVSRDGLHPHVRQIFQAMIDKPDKEFGSILSTLDTALIIYRNPVLVHNISESDLVMKDLMDCKKPISLYLVFGPGEIDVVRPLCRVIVEMMWRLNVEEMKFADGKMLEHKHRLLMLLDEFPALGKMGGIEQSEGFLAGYGIKLMIIAQDINQINSLYGKDNYVISNCQVQIFHAPSDNNSAKYLSEKLGNKTEKQISMSRNSVILPMPNSYNDSFMSRPLMYADEVSRMNDKKLLLFCKGLAPIMCNKIRYYEDEIFAPRVKIKAPPKSDIIDNTKRLWLVGEAAEEYVQLKEDDLNKLLLPDKDWDDTYDELDFHVIVKWSENEHDPNAIREEQLIKWSEEKFFREV